MNPPMKIISIIFSVLLQHTMISMRRSAANDMGFDQARRRKARP